jgi:predicted small lipoprotein YifL
MLFYLRSLITAGISGACVVYLAACGQQGPLYLPTSSGIAAPAPKSDVVDPPNESTRPAVDATNPK